MRQTYALVCWLAIFWSAGMIQAQHQARPALSTAGRFDAALYQGLRWRNIGPFRGGRSVAVAGVAHDPSVYYFGGTGGGLWKTEDAGQTWTNISDGFFRSGSVGAVAVAPADPDILYVGMGEHAVRGTMTSHGDGVYKSTDGGRTWSHAGLDSSRHIAAVVIDPRDPGRVFVAVQGAQYGDSEQRGVYKSTDGGRSWRRVLYLDPRTGACDLSIDPDNPDVLYAGMWEHRRTPWRIGSGGPGSGLYRSRDGGESWEKLGGGLPERLGKVAVAVSPARPSTLYANVESEPGLGGVYRSDDGGLSWRQTSADRATVGRAWYYTEIFPDPQDVETVYVLNEPLLRSQDGGRTFTEIATPHGDQHDLWINPARPDNFILANDGGACITFNGGRSWSSQQNQPTGQFYRVLTDQRFPYYVYGAQQDASALAIASRTAEAGIGPADWYTVAGCESAFLAFDPRHPRYVFGSCYQGYLEVFDLSTQMRKDISAYPALGLATPPREMKYRFNWNAPVVIHPQNPKILYHAANRILRSDNGGQSWQAISPDLTRDDPAKQGPGGGPFTNEGAGGENYNTISYLACSPHEAGTIWAGTDDGLVHLTRDEGKTWENVTPPGLGEALINSLELSPHRPGAAYIVATRHQFNDLQPLIFYTPDYGRSWQRITDGIDPAHFARVVREDPLQPFLLYAGTENGLYLSFDNGAHWQRFQLNLPVCPVTDLQIHDNDLVAATSGRGFWILDDLGALQQSMGRLPAERASLFRPKATVRFDSRSAEHADARLGENPPQGLIIDYYLPRALDSLPLTLEILNQYNQPVRVYRSLPDAEFTAYEGGPAPEPLLPARRGVNRFSWDMRRPSLPGVPGVYVNGSYRSGMVAPGIYLIRLITPTDTLKQICRLLPDPRLDAGPADYELQQDFLLRAETAVRDVHGLVRQMRHYRSYIDTLLLQLKKSDCHETQLRQGKRLQEQLINWENSVVQTRQQTSQDVINFPNGINAEFLYLLSRADTCDPRLTQGMQERLSDLLTDWSRHRAGLQTILDRDLTRFARLFQGPDLPTVMLPD